MYFHSPGKGGIASARKVKRGVTGYEASQEWKSLFEVESRSADCGRDEGGRFGPKNQCQDDGQPSRTTPHGKWNISEEPKEPSSDSRLATTHVVRLTGDDGTVKAYADVQMGGDNETLYVDFAWVAESHRGKGVYKSLLESLQNEYTVVSDEVHNVATPVRKAYESLGAKINQYGSYELKKKKKGESRSADCGRDEDGRFAPKNECQEEGSGGEKSTKAVAAVDDDLIDIKQIKPREEREPIDISELSAHQQASAARIRERGVTLQVESATASDDAFALVEQGIALLAETGLDWPREIRIGENGVAAASVHPDTGVTYVSETMTTARARNAIESGWFSGDVDLPMASILVHEQTHVDHYAALLTFDGDDDQKASVWDKITGQYDYRRLKREAKMRGPTAQFRPAAGLLEEYAWSPDYRPVGSSSVSAAEAMRIAETVSGYAKTNPPEFVSEFRAGVLSGLEYSDEAWDLYEAYAGPKLMRRKRK